MTRTIKEIKDDITYNIKEHHKEKDEGEYKYNKIMSTARPGFEDMAHKHAMAQQKICDDSAEFRAQCVERYIDELKQVAPHLCGNYDGWWRR